MTARTGAILTNIKEYPFPKEPVRRLMHIFVVTHLVKVHKRGKAGRQIIDVYNNIIIESDLIAGKKRSGFDLFSLYDDVNNMRYYRHIFLEGL